MKNTLIISFLFTNNFLLVGNTQIKAQDIIAILNEGNSYLTPPTASISMTIIGPSEESGHDYFLEVWTYVNDTSSVGDPLWLLTSSHPNESTWVGDQATSGLPDSTYRLILKASRIDVNNSNGAVTTLWDSELDTLFLETTTNLFSPIWNVFSVYPNPAQNFLTIETESGLTSGESIYQLQDVTGKVLLSGSVTATKFNLDISPLSKGIYLLSLIDGEQQVNRKVVKE